jgi:hypothetical protein
VKPKNEKDTRTHIETLQSLQKDINTLKKSAENNPSLEKTIETLRNSQDKLYSALAQHGITAEAVHKIIMENSDKAIVKEIMQLQKSKDNIRKQLAEPSLTSEKSQLLEKRFVLKSQQHTAKWDEIINSPDKDRIINKIEQSQIKALQKEERSRDKAHEHSRSR